MHIENITSIDYVFNQIEVEGYAVIHSRIPIVKATDDLPINLLLFVLDESGTLFRLNNLAENKEKCLIVGNNMITNLIFGYVLRRRLGDKGEITCLLDKKTGIQVTGGGIDRLISRVFDRIQYLDILKPTECVDRLNAESIFDLSVNCAEIPGAETVNILATRPGGTVMFANLINNLNIALYITESISKNLEVHGAEGFIEGYDDFDVEIVGEIAEYFENATFVKIEKNEPEDDVNPYSRSLLQNTMTEDFVFNSKAMKMVLDEILKVSRYDCNVIIFGETGVGKEKVANLIQKNRDTTVLLLGETGVGKEKVANLIQKNSDRKMQPFVKINCGAISPNLIESEFFGYEKGAFTGANSTGKKGYFEIANNGVMFLDEIGELPLEMQAKLLRVIQDGEFYRVGGTTPVKTNVRIISATNRDLEKFVEDGLFRRDLYYRLNVVPIRIPRLSDRPEDIPVLVNHFLSKYAEKFGTSRKINESAIDYLKQQPWPGNIRELENSVQRLIISSKGEDITLMDVMRETHGEIFGGNVEMDEGEESNNGIDKELDLQSAVDEYEKGIIKYACEKYGSTRKAAKAIGISQTQLVRKKKKYEV